MKAWYPPMEEKARGPPVLFLNLGMGHFCFTPDFDFSDVV